ILLVTARGDEADVLRGFARGADDYLRKPFSMAELVARVSALVRRRSRERSDVFFVGTLRIDLAAHEASCRGVVVELAAKEFDLLAHLAFEPGSVHTRDELLTRVWNVESGIRTRTLESHISRLRRKLVDAGVLDVTVA